MTLVYGASGNGNYESPMPDSAITLVDHPSPWWTEENTWIIPSSGFIFINKENGNYVIWQERGTPPRFRCRDRPSNLDLFDKHAFNLNFPHFASIWELQTHGPANENFYQLQREIVTLTPLVRSDLASPGSCLRIPRKRLIQLFRAYIVLNNFWLAFLVIYKQ